MACPALSCRCDGRVAVATGFTRSAGRGEGRRCGGADRAPGRARDRLRCRDKHCAVAWLEPTDVSTLRGTLAVDWLLIQRKAIVHYIFDCSWRDKSDTEGTGQWLWEGGC